jgi:hypothetical protein
MTCLCTLYHRCMTYCIDPMLTHPQSGNLPQESASGPKGIAVLVEQAVTIVATKCGVLMHGNLPMATASGLMECAVLLLLILMNEQSVANEDMKIGVQTR